MKKKVTIQSVKGGQENPRVVRTQKIGKRTFKIAVMPKKSKYGFIGANKEADKALKIKTNLPYNEVCYYPCRKKSTNRRTVHHELIEVHAMRYGHLPYHTAHKIALRFEDTRTTPSDALKWYRKH